MDVTIEEIEQLVAVQLGRRKVAADDRIIEDLGAESLDVVNIVATLEERYRIVIEEIELPDLVTVADLHACVRSRTGRSPAARRRPATPSPPEEVG